MTKKQQGCPDCPHVIYKKDKPMKHYLPFFIAFGGTLAIIAFFMLAVKLILAL